MYRFQRRWVILTLFCIACGLILISTYAQNPDAPENTQPTESVQEKVAEAEAQTEAVKKEAEIQEKALELEKQKAEFLPSIKEF